MEPKRIIGYSRVSSREQLLNFLKLEWQVDCPQIETKKADSLHGCDVNTKKQSPQFSNTKERDE